MEIEGLNQMEALNHLISIDGHKTALADKGLLQTAYFILCPAHHGFGFFLGHSMYDGE